MVNHPRALTIMLMKRLKHHGIFAGLLGSVFALAAIGMNTRPDDVPSLVLVVVFLFVYLSIAFTILALLRIFRSLGGYSWRPRALRRVAFGVSIVPVLLLILQSIGQLTVQDTLLTLAFAAVAYFYYQRFFVNRAEINNKDVQ